MSMHFTLIENYNRPVTVDDLVIIPRQSKEFISKMPWKNKDNIDKTIEKYFDKAGSSAPYLLYCTTKEIIKAITINVGSIDQLEKIGFVVDISDNYFIILPDGKEKKNFILNNIKTIKCCAKTEDFENHIASKLYFHCIDKED